MGNWIINNVSGIKDRWEGMLISTEEEDRMTLVNTTEGRQVWFIGRIREYDNGIYLKSPKGPMVEFEDRKKLKDPNRLDRLLYL